MPELAPAQLVLLVLIIFAAYFIRGVSGVGSALVAIPLLAHFLPLKTVVPMVLLLDFTASNLLRRATPGQAEWGELKKLLPASIAGVIAGSALILHLPQSVLLLGLGLFVAAFGLRSLLGIQGTGAISPWWALPTGLIGGAIGIVFGTGGPPYIIYLTHRLRDKTTLRATITRLFLVEGSARIIAFFLTGLLLDATVWRLALIGLLGLGSGLWLGNRVHLRLSSAQVFRFIGGLLCVSGLSLMARAF